jgi:hypothetical protein
VYKQQGFLLDLGLDLFWMFLIIVCEYKYLSHPICVRIYLPNKLMRGIIMSEDKQQQQLRTNEDFSKSYTHERPAPNTKPPTSRASSSSSDQSQKSSVSQSQPETRKK